MYEVELKVRADHDAVRARLRELDAERLGTVRQVDTYYDAPHREFADTDEALRIRREHRDGETATRITYKGPRIDDESKTRIEHETGVGDEEAAVGLFEGLGFEPAATVEKERDRYAIEGFTVTLDAVAGLGEFVEVDTEVPDEAAVPEAREAARSLLADLGLDPDDQLRTSYLGLLLEE